MGEWSYRTCCDRSSLRCQRATVRVALPLGYLETPPNTAGASGKSGYACLLRFVEREGHAAVPDGYREDGVRLGEWVGKQRAAFKEASFYPSARNASRHSLAGYGMPGRAILGWPGDAIGQRQFGESSALKALACVRVRCVGRVLHHAFLAEGRGEASRSGYVARRASLVPASGTRSATELEAAPSTTQKAPPQWGFRTSG